MKNVFRVLSMLLMAMTLSFSAVSCSDDDDEDEPAPAQTQQGGQGGITASSIIGTWSYDGGASTYTFNADGSYVDRYTDKGDTDYYYGSWSLSGTTLILIDSDGYQEAFQVSISGNQMTLTGGYGSVVLTRVG